MSEKNKPIEEEYEILSSEFVNPENSIINIVIKKKESLEEFPFTYKIYGNDMAPMSVWIRDLWENGSIKPGSYSGPSRDELNAKSIREKRNQLLDETDRFMVIDTTLNDEELKEMKSYRKNLRDITAQKSFPEVVKWPEKPKFLEEK